MEQQTIFFKEDIRWHYISLYLECLNVIFIDDEEYKRLYQKLRDYVETKLAPSIGGDIVARYVLVERKID